MARGMAMPVCVNTIETTYDNRVIAHETTWEVFRDVIMQGHVVAEDRKAIKLFNAAEYRPVEFLPHDQPELWVYDDSTDRRYTRRLQKNVLAVTMLILDYDGGIPLGKLVNDLRTANTLAIRPGLSPNRIRPGRNLLHEWC
jgi:hypothetical protein